MEVNSLNVLIVTVVIVFSTIAIEPHHFYLALVVDVTAVVIFCILEKRKD